MGQPASDSVIDVTPLTGDIPFHHEWLKTVEPTGGTWGYPPEKRNHGAGWDALVLQNEWASGWRTTQTSVPIKKSQPQFGKARANLHGHLQRSLLCREAVGFFMNLSRLILASVSGGTGTQLWVGGSMFIYQPILGSA